MMPDSTMQIMGSHHEGWLSTMRSGPSLIGGNRCPDFDNRTVDSAFDDTLKQALAIDLEQSPFLKILSDSEVSATLRLAHRDKQIHGAILFIEKEGFMEILRAANFQERFDIAVMSSKGMNTTAARTVIEQCSREGVRIFIVHDFDVSGFTITGIPSQDTDSYKFETTPDVIDLGLRLTDVRKMDLQSETVELEYDPTDTRVTLRCDRGGS